MRIKHEIFQSDHFVLDSLDDGIFAVIKRDGG